MADQLTFAELWEEMIGTDTTNGFDILVSYSQEKINALLKTRSEKLKSILDTPQLTATYYDHKARKYVDYYFGLKLNHPLLNFEDNHGNVTLTFDVLEGYTQDPGEKDKDPLPKGMIVIIKTNLVGVHGTVGSSPKPDQEPTSPNRIVVLNPDEKDISQGVSITFKKASIGLDGTTDEAKTTAQKFIEITQSLQEHFAENADLKYFMAGISNQYNPSSGSHPLRPRSFCFTTVAGKETGKIGSALCMWMCVEGGPNPDKITGGKTSATFHPLQRDLIPIARGTTCSLIMSKWLLVNRFLIPNLLKGFDGVKDATPNGHAGIRLTGKMKASDVDVPYFDGDPYKMQGVRFNPSDPVSTIDFNADIIAKSNEVKFTSNEFKAMWWYVVNHQTKNVGAVNLKFAWTAKGSWKDKSDKDHQNLLELNWKGDENWKVTTSAAAKSFWKNFGGGANGNPKHFTDMKIPGPDVNLKMDSLDYFLTTNLLYPGKHVFKADDPASTSKDNGLAVPWDLILTGQINTT